MSKKFTGIYTALITPFKGHEVDWESLEKLVDFQINNGISGFVVNGTTAESPNLTTEEVHSLFKFVKDQAGDEVPLLLGTGSNSTRDTVEKTQLAKDWGAEGALVVVPYYNKPTQEGLYKHFLTVAESVDIPLVLYNVPGRTITELQPQTLLRLQQHKNIVGIKEASGDIKYIAQAKPECKDDFVFTSGDDGTALEFTHHGGEGVISVVSHVIPSEFVSLFEKAKTNFSEASEEYKKYRTLLDLLFIEPNPTPVKRALYLMGMISSPECRLPLMTMTDENTEKLKSELHELKLC